MQRRFESELRFNASLLLLQERIPRITIFYAHTSDIFETHTISTDVEIRTITTPNTRLPEIQLLSNGHYQVMISNAGGGYSRWKNIAVTRWREDATKDDRGIFCYIKDVVTGKFWSNSYQPTLQVPKNYEAVFSHGHVELRRNDFGIVTKTEIVISPEDDVELRRIRITNKTQSSKLLEVTSYAEIVMASQASDEAHQAFSNLFVQTQIVPEQNTILCTRRPRSEEERPPWMFHLMHVSGSEVQAISYETDRMQFTGRGRTLQHPQAMMDEVLSGPSSSEDTDGPLAEEQKLVASAKKLGLFAAGAATQKYMQAIEDQQEIMGAIADMVIEIYAMETVLLRTTKILAAQGESAAALPIAMARVYLSQAMEKIEGLARKIISAVAEGDMLRTQLAILRRLGKRDPYNTIEMRRQIAEKIIERGRYSLM